MARWSVHLALVVTVSVALVFEAVLTVHVLAGLAFVGFVVAHLVQRRRTTTRLARTVIRLDARFGRSERLALADGLLAATTVVMLASGLWDWLTGHAMTVRLHALTGVALAVLVGIHTLRRRKRLRSSRVR